MMRIIHFFQIIEYGVEEKQGYECEPWNFKIINTLVTTHIYKTNTKIFIHLF